MNYKTIHDKIIDRARDRKYVSGTHHKHHIIPLCEDSLSTETVPLTFKEHYIVHLLRFKMGCSVGNLRAYEGLRNIPIHIWNLCSEAGKVGGKLGGIRVVEMQVGIHAMTSEEKAAAGKIGGASSHKMGVGIHGMTFEQRSITGRKAGKIGGKAPGKHTGFSIETLKEFSARGKRNGKLPRWTNGVINRYCEECPGEGFYHGFTPR